MPRRTLAHSRDDMRCRDCCTARTPGNGRRRSSLLFRRLLVRSHLYIFRPIRLLQLLKVLLRVRSGLHHRPGLDLGGYLLPLLAEHAEALEESLVFFLGPAARVLLARRHDTGGCVFVVGRHVLFVGGDVANLAAAKQIQKTVSSGNPPETTGRK